MTISVFFSYMKIIPTDFPIFFFGGTSDPFKNKIVLRSLVAHVPVSFRGMIENFVQKKFPKFPQDGMLLGELVASS